MAKKLTHYQVLGVSEDSSSDEIKAAWRRVAKTCHPDRTDDERKHRRFDLAVTAKEVLLDDELRAVYDHELREARMVSGGFSRNARSAAPVQPKEPKRHCERCGHEMGDSGCVRCALIDLGARRRAAQERARDGQRERRMRLDLDPVINGLNAKQSAVDVPAWEQDHADADSLLASLLDRSVSMPVRTRRGLGGPRVEIRISPKMVVVLDQSTFNALRRVDENIGFAKKMIDLVKRWTVFDV